MICIPNRLYVCFYSFPQKNCIQNDRASSETREFRDITKRDAVEHLKIDVEKLLLTVPPEEVDAARKNFNGFLKYYENFLKDEGAVVNWDKIQKLPEHAVSTGCEFGCLGCFFFFFFHTRLTIGKKKGKNPFINIYQR